MSHNNTRFVCGDLAFFVRGKGPDVLRVSPLKSNVTQPKFAFKSKLEFRLSLIPPRAGAWEG